MTKLLTAILMSTSLLLPACGSDDGAGDGGSADANIDITSNLTIKNASSFSFIEIYISPVGEAIWGPELLGSDVLEPGDEVEFSNIDCDSYDIRIVDEDADECIVDNIDLCADEATWTINDVGLADCVF